MQGQGSMADRIDLICRGFHRVGYIHCRDSRPDPFMTVESGSRLNGVDEPRGLSLQSVLHAPAHQDTVGGNLAAALGRLGDLRQ